MHVHVSQCIILCVACALDLAVVFWQLPVMQDDGSPNSFVQACSTYWPSALSMPKYPDGKALEGRIKFESVWHHKLIWKQDGCRMGYKGHGEKRRGVALLHILIQVVNCSLHGTNTDKGYQQF